MFKVNKKDNTVSVGEYLLKINNEFTRTAPMDVLQISLLLNVDRYLLLRAS